MKILSLLLFVFCFSGIQAQGNLQFNRVINLKNTANVPLNSTSTIATLNVPTDKVWKIESASINSGIAPNSYIFRDKLHLYVDSHLIIGTDPATLTSLNGCPLWLSSGTYPLIISNMIGSNMPCSTSLSIIEFNITP
jgi:hypothetical protein